MDCQIAIINGGLHEEQVFGGDASVVFHYAGDLAGSSKLFIDMLRSDVVVVPFHLDQILLSRYQGYLQAYIRDGGVLVILGANQESGRQWIPHVQWYRSYPESTRRAPNANIEDAAILLNDVNPESEFIYHNKWASHGIIIPDELDRARGDSVIAEGLVDATHTWQPIFMVKRSGISGTLLVTTLDPDFHSSVAVPGPPGSSGEITQSNAQKLLKNILIWARKEAAAKVAPAGKAILTDSREAEQVDIAIVTALDSPELEAVIEAGGGKDEWSDIPLFGDPNQYIKTQVNTSSGQRLSILAATPDRTGLTASAILTTKVLTTFRPRMLMMVGIAAGFDEAGVNIGDILVAHPAVDYGSGKITVDKDKNEVFYPTPSPVYLPARVKARLGQCRRDKLFLREIKDKWTAAKPETELKIVVGPLGSGDLVVDSPRKGTELQNLWRKMIGVEMEVYAVYQACQQAIDPPPDFLCLKSVCDRGQDKKNEWQLYAAFVAARYAFSLIHGPFENLFSQSSNLDL